MLKKLFKDSLLYTLSGSLSQLLGVLLLPFYTRVFTPTEYGVLGLLMATSAVVTQIVCMQINQSMARFYVVAKSDKKRQSVATVGLMYYLIAYLVYSLILIVFAKPISSLLFHGADQYFLVVCAMAVSAFFQALFYYNACIWRFQFKTHAFTIVSLFNTILTVLLIFIFVIVCHWGVASFFLGSAISAGVLTCVMMWDLRKDYQVSLLSWRVFKKMLHYGFPLVPASLIYILMQYIDQLMVNHYLQLGELGVYSIGLRIASVINLLMAGFQLAWGPLVLQNYKKAETPVTIAKLFYFLVLAAFFLVAGFTLFAPEILWFLTTSQFYTAYLVIPYLIASSFLISLGGYFSIGIGIAKKNWYLMWVTCCGLFINILLNVALIPKLGMLGAAIAMLVSGLLLAVIGIRISQKFYPVPYRLGNLVIPLVCLIIIVIIAQIYFKLSLTEFDIACKVILLFVFSCFLCYKLKRYATLHCE